ncbi:MAG TPA: hypothetical protein DIW47_09970 [Bacteroidetes bacterium]|nr:hypothetical protein [Bacteroidota bacterium]
MLSAYFAFRLFTRTNTIYAISYNHGIDVPLTTTAIEFESYRWWVNVRMDGNGSVVKCKMNKKDFEEFLKNQKWCARCYGIGSFTAFPDSLLGKYPMKNVELKTNISDVLLVCATEIPETEDLEVYFFSDCN